MYMTAIVLECRECLNYEPQVKVHIPHFQVSKQREVHSIPVVLEQVSFFSLCFREAIDGTRFLQRWVLVRKM